MSKYFLALGAKCGAVEFHHHRDRVGIVRELFATTNFVNDEKFRRIEKCGHYDPRAK